jgi:hypothetical protein
VSVPRNRSILQKCFRFLNMFEAAMLEAEEKYPCYLVQSHQAEETEQKVLSPCVRSCLFCWKHMYLQVALLQQM